MKLHATCTPFEAIPPAIWINVKNAILDIGRQWGVPLVVEDDLTVRDAEHRFHEWLRRPGGDTD